MILPCPWCGLAASAEVLRFLTASGNTGAALVIGGYTIAVARVGDRLYLFESHGYERVSLNAFCAVFSLGQADSMKGLIEAMMRDRMAEGDPVGFTTFVLRR